MGSKVDFFKLSRTRARSQWGTTRLTAGFSKSILLMTSERTGWEEKSTEVKCFRVEAIANLYPLMEEGKSFFSSKRKIRKSAIEVSVRWMGSISRWRHQSIQVFQRELYRDCVEDCFAAQTLSADFLENPASRDLPAAQPSVQVVYLRLRMRKAGMRLDQKILLNWNPDCWGN